VEEAEVIFLKTNRLLT